MEGPSVRVPAVAGVFYADREEELSEVVSACFRSKLGPGALGAATDDGGGRVLGLVVPHAGLVYSGPAAAHGYRDLGGQPKPSAVILLGPNHYGLGASLAVSPDSAWDTPLGPVPVDRELAERLVSSLPHARYDSLSHSREHSLEVQLPFLQVLFGNEVPIVPITMGVEAYGHAEAVGEALAELLRERDLIVVASSDFSHYVPSDVAQSRDRYALDAIRAVDPLAFRNAVARHGITLCGEGPIVSLLAAARALGGVRACVNTYYTSGAVTGDNERAVGYCSATLWR